MDLTHHIAVPASLDDTWAVFGQPQRLAPCFPGATITSVDGDDFTGSIKVKLGPLALVYEGAGRYVKRDQFARRLEIEFHGSDKRGHGAAEGSVTVGFTANGEATEIQVLTDLTITGKPEQFGHDVLSAVNDRLLDQFANCIAGRFADGSILAPEAPVEDGDAGSGASTSHLDEVPADVASGPALGPAEPSEATSAPAPARAPAAQHSAPGRTTPAPSGRPSAWVPASNYAETDFDMLRRVVPPLLKRYWPFLGGAGLATLVFSKISGRKKRR